MSEIVIGGYTIRRDEDGIWITGPDGDGGQFPEAQLEAAIAAYYKENF